MVKIVFVIFVILLNLQASVYEDNCVKCHKSMPVKIDKFFYRYLLKYSSEIETKYAISEYLKNPKKENSILNTALLNRFGVKKKTTLSDKKLKEAIDEYWDIYKVFGKLK
ncbi:MAG: hypothetical protein R3331_03250 [Sulfurospirillaceae bacterium]|nr:hypothetical protein [Sulfurospirillaceae bacterium]